MEVESGQDLLAQNRGPVEIGHFTYVDTTAYQAYTSTQGASRKRKMSNESAEPMGSQAKRQHLYARPGESLNVYASLHGPLSPATSLPQYGVPGGYAYPSGYDRPFLHQSYQERAPQQLTYQYPSTTDVSQPPAKVECPPALVYSPYSTASQTDRSPSLVPVSARSSAQAMPSVSSTAAPALIRTSTIQLATAVPMSANPTTQSFNPYAMYPSTTKAVLKIEGDLDQMSRDWTEDEWDAKRRLVQFQRSQTGSIITTSFRPVAQEEHMPKSICVSCIWWEEKQMTFVTSVDAISLLESLVAVRFTVEEKNRIRRNLEGFRPLTVSKARPDSESFFKVIMGFPNPKPRHIEKDVKVFPWRILGLALKKIIGKYSASYSSTAGALRNPGPSVASAHSSGQPLERGTEHPPAGSSRSASSSSTVPTGYATSKAISPSFRASAGPPGLRVTVPVGETGQGQRWQHLPALYPSAQSGTGRTSWDMSAYVDTSPVTAMPESAQSILYQRNASGNEIARSADEKLPVIDYQSYKQPITRT
ncbi:hypothetical protein LTR39_001699 [Cryomyces antarcticus]|nr:hypothetical protein LTR39_001699 [Cryomyces antarcticus]